MSFTRIVPLANNAPTPSKSPRSLWSSHWKISRLIASRLDVIVPPARRYSLVRAGEPAAVHQELGAGRERRLVGREEQREAGDLLGPPDPPEQQVRKGVDVD